MSRVITVVIDENGDLMGLNTPGSEVFFDPESTVTRRASHVEPDSILPRVAFHFLRKTFGERGRVAEWTRGWRVLWRVNTSPVGGPVLTWEHVTGNAYPIGQRVATFENRQEAIDTEVKFLNNWFLERGVQ